MNADGTTVIDPRLINTPELVVFEDPDDCLGNYISFFVMLDLLPCILLCVWFVLLLLCLKKK